MTQTHTPGPWATDEYGNEITAGNVLIGRAHSVMSASAKERKKFEVIGFDDVATLDANARLIAAAPELLDALISALKYLPSDTSAEDTAKAHAAIAKATGRA